MLSARGREVLEPGADVTDRSEHSYTLHFLTTYTLYLCSRRSLYTEHVGDRPLRVIGIVFAKSALVRSGGIERDAAEVDREARFRPSLDMHRPDDLERQRQHALVQIGHFVRA